jgi:PAS domain S-box-containing protein
MESELSRLVDALPGLVWTALPDGNIDFFNQRWCEYTGLSLDDSIGSGWEASIHPEDLSELLECRRFTLDSGEPREIEARLRRFDGEYRWFFFRSSPLTDTDRRVVRWCGIITDIDRQMRAAEEGSGHWWRSRAARENHFRSIVDRLPAFVTLMNPNGEAVLANRQVLEYFGATLDEVKGWENGSTIHPDDRPGAIAAWQRSVETGESFGFEGRHRRADGVYRWFQMRGFPLRDSEGRIVLWYFLQTDVENHKRTEEALRASEQNLRQIIDSIPGLVCTMSPAGAIEHQNQQVLDYFGRTAEELRDWAFTDAVHPDDLQRVIEVLTKSITTGTLYDIEHRCRRADGVYRWFQVRALPVRDTDNRVTGWYVLLIDIDDRKRAEEALRASERNLTQIINTIPTLAWSARPDGSAEFFNQHYVDYLGLSQEQAQEWGWTTAVHPDDLNSLAGAWQHIRASEEPGESEARLRRFDGEYRWFLFRANPLRDESGKIVKWYGTNTDIDDRKRAEEELRRSEARKTAILDSALDCIVTIDHEGHITEFNPAAERTFGYCRDEAVGKRLADVIIPPSLREGHRQGFTRYLATGEARVLGKRVELTAARADGSEFPVELAISRIPLEGPPSFTGYLRDITERRLAEEELRRSEAFLAEGQRLSRTGSFSWRVATEEITWSEQVYSIFELEPDLPVTLGLLGSRVHPEDIPLLCDMVERAKAGKDFEYEHRLLLPENRIKYLHLVGHGTRNKLGELEYIGAVQDVTERRLSEEALGKVRSELAHVARVTSLGALTASIAHEVNQPLSGIVTNASTCLRMLAADPPNIDGARETARRTIRDGNRASEVITRLRALFSKEDITTERVDLNEATREVIALSLGELQGTRVMLRSELANGLPPVAGDRVQLQQVILNLLRNALDAMSAVEDRPRQLVIRTEQDEGDLVRLTMQDTGVGLDSQNLERLFDAFYTTKSSGMGMGLSVCRSIIERHRGRLWAAPNDGPGATFSFSIPHGFEGAMGTHNLGAIREPAVTDAAKVMRKS